MTSVDEAPTLPMGRLATLRAMRRDPLTLFTAAHRDFGPIVRIPVPGLRLFLVSDPAAIQDALTHTNHGFAKGLARRKDPGGPGFQPLERLLGQGLLTASADVHRPQRRLIQPLFHKERIAEYAREFVDQTHITMAGWSDGQARDLHADITELTLAIIARTVFDVSLDSAAVHTVRRTVGSDQSVLRRSVTPLGRLMDRLPLPSTRRARAALADLDAIIYGLISQRRTNGPGADLLSLLMGATDAETGAAMDDRQVRDEAMTLLLAGHETTANNLAWTLHLLSERPDVQERLADEVDAVLGERGATAGDLPDLRFTSAVIHESMRLFPPAWMLARRLTAPRPIGGYPLSAGDVLVLSPWVVHRDPALWHDPLSFDPDRWLTGGPAHRFAYFPFGGGPRQCIGNAFADMEATLILATMAGKWHFVPAAGAPPVVPHPQVTLRPRAGVVLTIKAR
jgi:cytochrome P450